MDSHGAKYTQIDEGMCQGVICTCQNFFPFTNLVVRVTFLKVILDLLKNALIWSFLISLAVVSYFSAPLFLTSPPHHCYIAQHCLSIHGGYWCNKNVILIKILPELLYFLSQSCIFSFQWSILLEFLSNRDTVTACFACNSKLLLRNQCVSVLSRPRFHSCCNNLAHFYGADTALWLVEPITSSESEFTASSGGEDVYELYEWFSRMGVDHLKSSSRKLSCHHCKYKHSVILMCSNFLMSIKTERELVFCYCKGTRRHINRMNTICTLFILKQTKLQQN